MVLPRYFRTFFKPEIYGPGYKGFFKQCLYEHTLYFFSLSLFAISAVSVPLCYLKWMRIEGHKRRFMHNYTIFRSDDPFKDRYFYIDVNDKNNIIDPARKTYYDVD